MSDPTTTRAVAILLDGPMQSWGSSSRFTRRETEAFPTKSALIGLLAAAAGIDKHAADEAEQLAPLAALRLSIFRLPQPGGRLAEQLSDFHTVGGGYDAKDSAFDKMSIPRKASGGPSANAVITHRSYLTGVRFIACFSGAVDVVEAAARQLGNPVWGVWFGRKTCLPAMPLSPILGADALSAARTLLDQLRQWEEATHRHGLPPDLDPAALESWSEPEPGQTSAGDFHLQDQPASFGKREFHTRGIRHHRSSS